VRIGDFELQEQLGKGGMGVVYRAVHHGVDGVRTPVAVKLLDLKRAMQPHVRDLFRQELEAVAGLDHPGIVAPYAWGTVPAKAADQPDQPFLAMELVNGGTLGARERRSWSTLRTALLQILSSLAHAHARGVIHRDLKPGNVLLTRSGDAKLTDFGIAHVIGRANPAAARERVIGTPAYMSPEQVRGHWRDFGPWSDLYALGCLAWGLATGAPPFAEAGNSGNVLHAQLVAHPPTFQPRFAVPVGFEGWLRTLLAKHIGTRFCWAADAAAALAELSPSSESADPHGVTELPTQSLPTATAVAHTTAQVGLAASALPRAPASARATAHRVRLDCPRRSERVATKPLRLQGVGQALYGLREVPLCGPEVLNDRMWGALVQIGTTGHARTLVLRGPSGCGKTRRATWLTRHAHEVGAAQVLGAVHSAVPGAADGIGPMLRRFLRCDGLDAEGVKERLAARLPTLLGSGELDALAGLLSTNAHDATVSAGPVRPSQQAHYLVECLLRRLCWDRPLVLVVDDAQWGQDALALAAHLLRADAAEPLPVLLVVAVRDEDLATGSQAARRLDALLALPRAESLPIDPLTPEHHRELVHSLLGLDGALATRVAERTQGNPHFAVQLVGDWVERGVLEISRAGFTLKPGVDADLPNDLAAVWTHRVARLQQQCTLVELCSLEIAAALGQTLRTTEWRSACQEAGLEEGTDVVARLAAQRLALRNEDGWSFCHGMLREVIADHARLAARWSDHNKACARMLEGRVGLIERERRGRHLLHAGLVEQAADVLLEAARDRFSRMEFVRAHIDLADREMALGAEGSTDRHAHFDGLELAAQSASRLGRHEQAMAILARYESDAEASGSALFRARALHLHGVVIEATEGMGPALPWVLRGQQAWPLNEGSALRRLKAVRYAAYLLSVQGKLDHAELLAREGLEQARVAGETGLQAEFARDLAWVAGAGGDIERALELLADARALLQDDGSELQLAFVDEVAAVFARRQGDLDTALRLLESALAAWSSHGSMFVFSPLANLGMVHLVAGREGEAERMFQRAERAAIRAGVATAMAFTRFALAAIAAGAGEWEDFDTLFGLALESFAQGKMVELDFADILERIANRCLEGGQPDRAAAAITMATAQYEALGDRAGLARMARCHRI
jgi:eukaryotic-like serine/threonine-protein kinase